MTHNKFFLLTLIVNLLIINSYSQNVGIGTQNPQERLDVNGNINLNGDLKVNGNFGTSGQVLMKSSNGLIWSAPCDKYENNFVVRVIGSGNFTIPLNVTKVFVEIWGGGGAGSNASGTGLALSGGGGGGGYVMGLLDVTGLSSLSYYVGNGGVNGDSSFVSNGSVRLMALGGKGAGARSGEGGGYIGPSVVTNFVKYYVGINGENGGYAPEGAAGIWADGGNAGNTINTKGFGTHYALLIIGAKQPGGGGGSAQQVTSLINGAPGMIIFWW